MSNKDALLEMEQATKSPLGPFLPNPLDDVYAFLGKFLSYPSDDARVAHALWIVHTHLMDKWESTPRLAFSPVRSRDLEKPVRWSYLRLWCQDRLKRSTPHRPICSEKYPILADSPQCSTMKLIRYSGRAPGKTKNCEVCWTQDIDVGPSLAGASSEERRLKRKSCQPFVRWPWQD